MSDPQRPLAGRRILVAEDDPLMQFVLGELLEEAGIEVTLADDGAAAVVHAHEGHYHWVLMDVLMPRMDGLVATRHLRSTADTARLCIIGLSGNDDPDSRRTCSDAGMSDFLAKPVDPEQLFERLDYWLDRPHGALPTGTAAVAADSIAAAMDFTRLDELSQGDAVRAHKYAAHFLTALEAGHTVMAQELADGDLIRLAGEAHRLKSSARWVGALHLGEILAAIEQAAKAGQLDMLPALLDNGRTAGADFSGSLQRYLDQLSS
jgi:CheY-like chemotaxis protein